MPTRGRIGDSETVAMQPVSRKIESVHDDDQRERSSAHVGQGAGQRGRVLWWVLGIGVVLFLLLLAAVPTHHGHGSRPIRVTGRLVWGPSQEPIVGARVMFVSRYDLEHGWNPEESWQMVEIFDAARREAIERGEEDDSRCWLMVFGNAGTRTGQQGSIEILLGLGTTVMVGRFFNSTDMIAPEDEVAALWIAPDGGEPVLVRIETAIWREAEDGEADGVWGTYDLGTVVVPVGEPNQR